MVTVLHGNWEPEQQPSGLDWLAAVLLNSMSSSPRQVRLESYQSDDMQACSLSCRLDGAFAIINMPADVSAGESCIDLPAGEVQEDLS